MLSVGFKACNHCRLQQNKKNDFESMGPQKNRKGFFFSSQQWENDANCP